MSQLPSLFLGLWGVMIFWLAGNKSVWAWRCGLPGQVWWATYAIWLGQYGLLVSCGMYGVVYLRNLLLWRREQQGVHSSEPVAQGVTP